MDKTSLIQNKLRLESRLRSSAHWFYWIAGLSLINTIVVLTGGSLNFIFGLGATQIIDSFAYYFAPEYGSFITYIAVALDVFIACVFILIGKFAGKRKKWAFITGMILYVLDGLVFLIWADYLSLGFHGFALYSIYLGLPAIKDLAEAEKQLAEVVQEDHALMEDRSTDFVDEEAEVVDEVDGIVEEQESEVMDEEENK
ncbi:MAG TPA: hypothetical protein VEF53_16500 [Patescibacteria group bacterium]|nr:hypothetical protein [Patescibacteria group bacterium]